MSDGSREDRGERPTRELKPQRSAHRIGPYRIEGEIGRGGMGVVHRAFDERLHRLVALKALPADLAGDREQLERLEREARALASVQHPNVAAIHGMEEEGGTCWLVLELIEGETLDDRLERGALELDSALEICGQVAAGLSAVHGQGLVHRDLKPSNVMLTEDGRVKLLDFGLARRSSLSADRRVTPRGTVIGTPGWMSPEQLRGEALDPRSDVFAWGCLIYECLTAWPAFPGESAADRSAATLERDPDWSRLPAGLPPSVEVLLRSCLRKEREHRPADARALLEGLAWPPHATAEAGLPARGHLPPERDEFVGRERELRRLREALSSSRLVSVLGVGGTGKTRLVLHHARERAAEHAGGVWFCDLSEARSRAGIVHAFASALDVRLGADEPVERLGHALDARGDCLVILDNFEQVARHADETLGRWLDRCPSARFVVTTREVLGLPEETSLNLAPLSDEDAVALFTVRAGRRGREVGRDERAVVEELVRLLDRLPLAVELAAARCRVLTPEQLLERLGDRFRLLSSTGDRLDRQATLRATLDWSWELLSDWERAALAQCSVFEGGFTLAAAEAVLDLSAWPEAPWPMDAVQSLVEKSLLEHGRSDRFDLLVSVQEYAAEKLRERGAAAVAAAERRHGEFFAGLGRPDALDALVGPGSEARRAGLRDELDNLVAACRKAIGRADGATAVSTFAAAWALLRLRGPVAVGEELGRAVVALEGLAPPDRSRALGTWANALRSVGRPEEALASWEEALAERRRAADDIGEARLLLELGAFRAWRGENELAEKELERALALCRTTGDRVHEGIAHGHLASLRMRQGRTEEARRDFERALELHRAVGDRASEGVVLSNLGNLFERLGDPDAARESREAALSIHRELGDRHNEAVVLGNLASANAAKGEDEEARAQMERALTLHRESGHRHSEGTVLGMLGLNAERDGRLEDARALLEQALTIHEESGYVRARGHWLAGLSAVALRSGQEERAVELAEAAVESAAGSPPDQAEMRLTLATVQLAVRDLEGAAATLLEAERDTERDAGRGDFGVRQAALRARLLQAQGDERGARRELARAEELASALSPVAQLGCRRDLDEARAGLD